MKDQRTGSKDKTIPSASPRPPLPRSLAQALPDSTANLLPDKDTPFGHPGGTARQITVSADNQLTVPKVHVRGLIFSRAPKHERMHLCCMHRIRHQSIPCPPIHAPLRQLSGSQIHAHQRKASCGATVNCRMSIVYSNRSTGDWPLDWPRFFIHRSPQPAVHRTVASR